MKELAWLQQLFAEFYSLFTYYINESTIQQIPVTTFWSAWGAALIALCFTLHIFRRTIYALLAIQSTPTSKLRSAAQGYVEIIGTQSTRTPMYSPLSKAPCTWYHYKIYETQDKRQYCIEDVTSVSPFWISDTTGNCLVISIDAIVEPALKVRWGGFRRFPKNGYPTSWFSRLIGSFGPYTYVEERMNPNAYIYVLGGFRTVSPHQTIAEDQSKKIIKTWDETFPHLKSLKKSESLTWSQVIPEFSSSLPNTQNTTTMNIISSLGLDAQQPFIISGVTQEQQARRLQYRILGEGVLSLVAVVGLIIVLTLRL